MPWVALLARGACSPRRLHCRQAGRQLKHGAPMREMAYHLVEPIHLLTYLEPQVLGDKPWYFGNKMNFTRLHLLTFLGNFLLSIGAAAGDGGAAGGQRRARGGDDGRRPAAEGAAAALPLAAAADDLPAARLREPGARLLGG